MAIKPHPHFRVHLSERRPNTVTIKDFLRFWVCRFIVVDEFFGFVNQSSTKSTPLSLSIHLYIYLNARAQTTVHCSIIYIYLWLKHCSLITLLSPPSSLPGRFNITSISKKTFNIYIYINNFSNTPLFNFQIIAIRILMKNSNACEYICVIYMQCC